MGMYDLQTTYEKKRKIPINQHHNLKDLFCQCQVIKFSLSAKLLVKISKSRLIFISNKPSDSEIFKK